MISKRDSKPILVKFPIGVLKSNKTDTIYEDNWNTIYGLVSDPSGSLMSFMYGNDLQFDKMITVNSGSLSKRIDYNTIIMIDNMPTQNYPLGDYKVKRIFPEYNGEIRIGLSKVEAVNMPKLYFFIGEQVLFTQLNFDNISNCAYISSKQAIPFELNSYVYTREPSSETTTTGRLKFTGYSKTGLDNGYKAFFKLTFEEDNG